MTAREIDDKGCNFFMNNEFTKESKTEIIIITGIGDTGYHFNIKSKSSGIIKDSGLSHNMDDVFTVTSLTK